MRTRKKWAIWMAALTLVFLSGSAPGSADPGTGIEAISLPSEDIALSFTTVGKVSEVRVKEGDAVEKGQELARLDDTAEAIEVEQLRAQSEDSTRLRASRAELAQKRQDLSKLESARLKGAATDWEVDHARVGVHIAELAVKAAVLEREQARRRYAQAVSQLERMRLVSPISGRVESVSAQPGEAAKHLTPVIQLVKTDPLWIEVHVPLAEARQLKVGQKVWVAFPESAAPESANGKIVFVSSVADAASDTLQLRVEAANPRGRPAGERTVVRFQAPAPADPSKEQQLSLRTGKTAMEVGTVQTR